jgi:DNA-binding PadR family transcriptional regulator
VSAKHAILGLVIERPGYARRIAARARRQLRFASLADSYPYWALQKLEAEGLVRQVDEDGAQVGSPGAERQRIYEATVDGRRAFDEWLRSIPEECSLRDDIQFKLAGARPSHLPLIIELIRYSERVCAAREHALEQDRPAEPKDRCAWYRALHDAARAAELTFWQTRTGWLQSVRETVEDITSGVARRH